MTDKEMSLPYSLAPALRYQMHKYVSWALCELQNSFATPPLHNSPKQKVCVRIPLYLFFKVREVCNIGERGEIRLQREWTCSVGLKHCTSSPLHFPPSSASSENAASFWLCTVSKKDPRRKKVYRLQWLIFHSSDQNEMSFPYTAVLQRVALKLKIMG